MPTPATMTEPVTPPWNTIYIPEGRNYRGGALPRIQALAESIEKQGLLQPVGVRLVPKGASHGLPYEATFGFRRLAAWSLLGREDDPIPAVLKKYAKGDAIGPLVDNYHANEESESTSPLDQAALCHQLNTGDYPVDEGTAEPLDRKEIAAALNLSASQVQKFLKLHTALDAAVAKKARKEGAPLRLLIAISNTEPDLADDGQEGYEAAANDAVAALQMKALDAWIDARDGLKAAGRERAPRGSKNGAGDGDGDGEGGTAGKPQKAKPLVSPKKVIDAKGRTADVYRRALAIKLEATRAKAERAPIEAALAVTEYFLGNLKKFPGIVAADLKAVADADQAAADEEAEEARAEDGDEETEGDDA